MVGERLVIRNLKSLPGIVEAILSLLKRKNKSLSGAFG